MREERAQVLTQGLIAGLLAYAAVVLFFLVINVIGGQSPFHTPAALGSALFYGLRDPSRLVVEPGPVLAYNGVHMTSSLVAGTIAAWLLYETERHHFLWYFVLFLFLIGFVFSLVVLGVVGAEIAHVLPWWSVLAGNLVWAISLGAYLSLQHRGLVRGIREEEELGE